MWLKKDEYDKTGQNESRENVLEYYNDFNCILIDTLLNVQNIQSCKVLLQFLDFNNIQYIDMNAL